MAESAITRRQEMLERLSFHMRSLYSSGDYFVSVPPASQTFEENYWHEVVDPDGNRRDRLSEREQVLRPQG